MPPEEAARYRLDDCLGGSSATVHQRAIRRIYGDKSADIVEGLKRNPGKKNNRQARTLFPLFARLQLVVLLFKRKKSADVTGQF